MADFKSVSFAAAIHFVLRVSMFLKCSNCLSHLWNFPSFLVLASVCMILVDIGVLPERYKRKNGFHLLIEVILSLFIMEVVMILIWSNIEIVAEIILKSALKNIHGEGAELVTNVFVLIFSIILFSYTTSVTNNWKLVEKEYERFKIIIQGYFKNSSSRNCQDSADLQSKPLTVGPQVENFVERSPQVLIQKCEDQPQGFLALVYSPSPICPENNEEPCPPIVRTKRQPKSKRSR